VFVSREPHNQLSGQRGEGQHLLGQPSSVTHCQGPPSLQCVFTPMLSRSLASAVDGPYLTVRYNPHSFRKSQ